VQPAIESLEAASLKVGARGGGGTQGVDTSTSVGRESQRPKDYLPGSQPSLPNLFRGRQELY